MCADAIEAVPSTVTKAKMVEDSILLRENCDVVECGACGFCRVEKVLMGFAHSARYVAETKLRLVVQT